MKKFLLLFVFLFFGFTMSRGQYPSTFFKLLTGAGSTNIASKEGFISTLDGGYIIAGDADSQRGSIIKLDSLFNFQWEKRVEIDPDEYVVYTDIIQLDDSSFIVSGFNNEQSDIDMLLTKISPAGNILWNKTYDGSGHYMSAKLLKTTGINFWSIGRGNGNIALTYFDSSGNVLVQKNISGTSLAYNLLPSSSIEFDIKKTNDNGFIVATTYLVSDYENLIIKCDSTGNIQWARRIGNVDHQEGWLVQPLLDGRYFITGQSSTGNYPDQLIYLLNDSGIIEWSKLIVASGYWESKCIIQTSDSGIVICSRQYQPIGINSGIMKINTDGEILWIKGYGFGDMEICTNVLEIENNALLITGRSNDFTSIRSKYLAKLTPEGNLGCYNTPYMIDSVIDFPLNNVSLSPSTNSTITTLNTPLSSFVFLSPSDSICACSDFPDPEIIVKGCLNNSLYLFETNLSPVSQYQFNWSFSNGINSTSPTPQLIIDSIAADTIIVYLEVSDVLSGCTYTDQLFHFEELIFSDTFFYSLSGFTATFNYDNPNNFSVLWDLGSGNTDTINNPVFTYDSIGNYPVSLTIYSFCDSLVIYDTVRFCTNMPSPQIFVSDCSQASEFAFYTNVDSSSLYDFSWTFNTGDTSNLPTPVLFLDSLAQDTITAYVQIMDSIGCQSSAELLVFQSIMLDSVFNTSILGLTVIFNYVDSSAINFLWDFGDGNISTLQNPTHSYGATGIYYVCLNVYGICDSVMICDSLQINNISVTSFVSNNYLYASCFPNPFNDRTRIVFNNELTNNYSIKISSVFGVTIYEINEITGREIIITNEKLSPGVYFLSVHRKSNNQKILTLKLVVN